MSASSYLFPPVCVACGIRREPNATGPLCEACLAKWEDEKGRTCVRCGRRMRVCACQPLDGVVSRPYPVFALASYRHGTVAERLVLAAKRQNNAQLFSFLADALAVRLAEAGVCGGRRTVVTYVPRSRKNRWREGQDQGRLLATAISRQIDSSMARCFCHRGGVSQKKLAKEARFIHAAKAYRPRKGLDAVAGKTVILVDDVCTGGASLATCYAYLRQAGAARVICLVVAKAGC